MTTSVQHRPVLCAACDHQLGTKQLDGENCRLTPSNETGFDQKDQVIPCGHCGTELHLKSGVCPKGVTCWSNTTKPEDEVRPGKGSTKPSPSERWRCFVTIEDPLLVCLVLYGPMLNRSHSRPNTLF